MKLIDRLQEGKKICRKVEKGVEGVGFRTHITWKQKEATRYKLGRQLFFKKGGVKDFRRYLHLLSQLQIHLPQLYWGYS